MSNRVDLLEADVRAAATAIVRARAARRGDPDVPNVLGVLPPALFGEVVEEARGALAAGRAAAPPTPRPRGPLNALDAAALGLELGAGTLLILVRDAHGRAAAALWARSAAEAALDHDAAQRLWSACAAVLADLPDSPEPPSDAEQRP